MHALTRWWIFYPLVALAAVGLVWLSLGRSWTNEIEPAPQAGRSAGDTLVLDASSLARPETPDAADLVFVVERDETPTGLRVARRAPATQPAPDEKGVRILLAPQAAAPFAGRRVVVEVDLRAIGETTARNLALSLQGEGPSAWVTQPLASLPATIRYELPPGSQTAPAALGLRVVDERTPHSYGVEIVEIRLTPAG